MRFYPAEKAYPNFNDKPHERPILTHTGEKYAVAILAGLLTILAIVLLILSQMP